MAYHYIIFLSRAAAQLSFYSWEIIEAYLVFCSRKGDGTNYVWAEELLVGWDWVLDWYVLLLGIHAHECTATVCLSALICFIEMCMGAVTTILALRVHSNCWGCVLICLLCKQSWLSVGLVVYTLPPGCMQIITGIYLIIDVQSACIMSYQELTRITCYSAKLHAELKLNTGSTCLRVWVGGS